MAHKKIHSKQKALCSDVTSEFLPAYEKVDPLLFVKRVPANARDGNLCFIKIIFFA